MNIYFFSGKIISDIEFKFIISKQLSLKRCKHTSISIFKILLNNGTTIKIKAYDNLADFCYRKLNKNDFISGYGNINEKFELDIAYIDVRAYS